MKNKINNQIKIEKNINLYLTSSCLTNLKFPIIVNILQPHHEKQQVQLHNRVSICFLNIYRHFSINSKKRKVQRLIKNEGETNFMFNRVHFQASFGLLCQIRVSRHLVHFHLKCKGLLNFFPNVVYLFFGELFVSAF